jgi:hypothetical protein
VLLVNTVNGCPMLRIRCAKTARPRNPRSTDLKLYDMIEVWELGLEKSK